MDPKKIITLKLNLHDFINKPFFHPYKKVSIFIDSEHYFDGRLKEEAL
jgi:hypothetical protein